jgi:hypothetical protein
MPIVFINPGTEPRTDTTLENAELVLKRICEDLRIDRSGITRSPSHDDFRRGLYAFQFEGKDRPFIVEIPGDDYIEVCAGVPFRSRRLYVDGSSWLYGFALDAIERRIKGEE